MRYNRRKAKIKTVIISWVVLIGILLTVFIAYSEKRLRPMIKSLVIGYAQSFATDAINESVNNILNEYGYTYDDIVNVNYSSDGSVDTITGNYVNINRLKADISLESQKKINKIQSVPIEVHLGVFSGVELLKNIGPKVSLDTYIRGGVTTKIISDLKACGVNQTMHTIEVEVSADINAYTTGIECNTSLTTNVILAQTVIVGDVPDLCLDTPTVS